MVFRIIKQIVARVVVVSLCVSSGAEAMQRFLQPALRGLSSQINVGQSPVVLQKPIKPIVPIFFQPNPPRSYGQLPLVSFRSRLKLLEDMGLKQQNIIAPAKKTIKKSPVKDDSKKTKEAERQVAVARPLAPAAISKAPVVQVAPAIVPEISVIPKVKADVLVKAQQPQYQSMTRTAMVPVKVNADAVVPFRKVMIQTSQSADKTFAFVHIPESTFRLLGQTIVRDNTGLPYAVLAFPQTVQKLQRLSSGSSTAIVQVGRLRNRLIPMNQALQVQQGSARIDFEKLQKIAKDVSAQFGQVSVSLVQPGKAGQSIVLHNLGQARYVMTPRERYVLVPLTDDLVKNLGNVALPKWVTLAFSAEQSFVGQQPMLSAGNVQGSLSQPMPSAQVQLVGQAEPIPQRSVPAKKAHVSTDMPLQQPQQLVPQRVGGDVIKTIQIQPPLVAKDAGQIEQPLKGRLPKTPEAQGQPESRQPQPSDVRNVAGGGELKPIDPANVVIRGQAQTPESVKGKGSLVNVEEPREEIVRKNTPESELAVEIGNLPKNIQGTGRLVNAEEPREEIVRRSTPESELAVKVDELPEVRRGTARELEKPKLQRARMVRARAVRPNMSPIGPLPPAKLGPVAIKSIAPVVIKKIKETVQGPQLGKKSSGSNWNGDRILLGMLSTLASQLRLVSKRSKVSVPLQERIVQTLATIRITIDNFIRVNQATNLTPSLVKTAQQDLENSEKVVTDVARELHIAL
jgi:hypothetical protein